jgi:hypothetical protein
MSAPFNLAPRLTSDHRLIVPVVRRTAYTIGLEQPNSDSTFVHCSMHVPWTARVKRQLVSDWRTVLHLHGGPLYCLADSRDLKLHKFLRAFGFSNVASVTDLTTGLSDLIFSTKERTDG